MAIRRVPKEQLDLGRELSAERLAGYARQAFGASSQNEAATHCYYALMAALHWLELGALGHKTTCHTEPIGAELETTLAGLARAGVLDGRRQTEARVIFHYWIVGYWDADPGSAHLAGVRAALASFLRFFLDEVEPPGGLARLIGQDAAIPEAASDDQLAALLAEVKHLYDTLDVGEW